MPSCQKYPLLPLKRSLFSYCFNIIIIIHFLLLQTCTGHYTPDCPPSPCGKITKISYPFRLRNDPQYCGEPEFELACEKNTTLYLDESQKYIVQGINYDSYTFHLTDPSILENDTCSLPNYSTDFGFYNGFYLPYNDYMIPGRHKSFVITFMSCPFPVNNSSRLLKVVTADCGHRGYGFNLSDKKHTYISFGNGLYRSDIVDMCTIELMAMTSSLPPEAENSSSAVSIPQIHTSLLYGFEISWFTQLCMVKCHHYYCYIDGKNTMCVFSASYNVQNWCKVGTIWQFSCDGMPVWFHDAFGFITLKLQLGLEYGLAIRSIIGIACMVLLLIYKLRRRHLSTFDVIEGFLQSNHNLMPIRYSYLEIKIMTRGFREKLGQGGYGSVYKGKLRSGHAVAVKLLNKPKENGQDFINEIATIGRIHHVNVVKLIGFCAGRFNKKRALIFDFMPNGSLEKHIFSQQNSNPLSWERKYEIAVGVARGIEYLHRGCDIQILHFDIKPHNILLDDNFTPKISDFGLAKLYATDNNTVTLTAARGTIGYVAPELINRSLGGVSYKADVYSFGMLLIEMVGLNRHISANDEQSSQYFPDWIYKGFNKGEDIEMGDVDIIEDNDNDGDEKRITRKMTVVGLWCIQMSPADRPSMSEVVKMLESKNANIQIPPQPSEPTQTANNSDHAWGTESSGSTAVMGDYASSDLSKIGGSCIEMSRLV